LLSLISVISYSQYLPLLDESHSWNVDLHGSTIFGGDPYIITNEITVSGSTIINGNTYKTIINSNVEEINCLVREENGKVFRYIEDLNDEILMYDFTLEVGDSFVFFENTEYCSIYGSVPSSPISAQVVFVDFQFIAGEERKVIEFEYFFEDDEIWIEGIGSIRGFDSVGVVYDIIDGTDLVCFTNTVDTYYFNGANSCDNTTLNIDDIFKDSIVLYPNPVSNRSILNIPSELLADKLLIVDVTGKIIKEEKINKSNFIINVMNYPSGIYFYQVYSENNLIKTDRFIIK
ncbi:MAG: hypothetical protein COB12_12965, partial [Flavobacterium sp.]